MVCGKLEGKMSMKSFLHILKTFLILQLIICSSVCQPHSVASERYVVSMMFAMRPLRTHNFGVFSFFSLQSSRIPFYAFISKVRQIYRRCVCLRSDSECVGDGKFIV